MILEINTMIEPSPNEKSHKWSQYLAAITSILMAVSSGLNFGWPCPTIPKIMHDELHFHVSKHQVPYIVMLSPLGYIIGCPVSAILLDKIGRKFSIMVLAAPQILAWLLIANSTNIYMLYMARLTAGISEGGAITTIPVYIGEIAEPKIRGALGMSFSVAFLVGSLLINSYGSYLSVKTASYISLCIPLLFVVTFIWMPESPYFFLIKGHTEEARKSLQWLRSIHNVETELLQLTANVQRQLSEPKSIRDVFMVRSNLKPLFLIIGLRTVQQFSGGASISFYNQCIFKEADGFLPYRLSSIIVNLALVTVSCLTTRVVDRFGRRPLLMVSTLGSGMCLFLNGVYFSLAHGNYDMSWLTWLPMTAMILYTVTRGFGLVSIPTLMSGEMFSASVKGKAVGMVNIYFAFCMTASSKLFYLMKETIGMFAPFYVFAFVCVVGTAFIYYFIPETKGKTLEEIQQQLKGNVGDQIE